MHGMQCRLACFCPFSGPPACINAVRVCLSPAVDALTAAITDWTFPVLNDSIGAAPADDAMPANMVCGVHST